MTPSKCTVFGVNSKALPQQVNFLTDEAGYFSKGANAVISNIHFFEHHSLRETDVYLHTDNCCRQNNKKAMMRYLAYINKEAHSPCWSHQILT